MKTVEERLQALEDWVPGTDEVPGVLGKPLSKTQWRTIRWVVGVLLFALAGLLTALWEHHIDHEAAMRAELRQLHAEVVAFESAGGRMVCADGIVIIEAMLHRSAETIDFSPRDRANLEQALAALRSRCSE